IFLNKTNTSKKYKLIDNMNSSRLIFEEVTTSKNDFEVETNKNQSFEEVITNKVQYLKK
ncbi:24702_t:CDS:1, partial [Dentiscutata erythropus]